MAAQNLPKPSQLHSSASSLGEQVLAHAQAGREVIQDFCALADSLEWQLGQQYFRERGNKVFIADSMPIPFIINNDGTLSRHAAEVFFTSLLEADKSGTLEPELFVLEIGVGVGLFARFFLDHVKALCIRHRKDYYDRLCYVAADKSERMLTDLLQHGLLSNHLGHYCVDSVDAMQPEKLAQHLRFRKLKGKPFHAVFLNYLLDCLPPVVLQIEGDQLKQLCVRTCVARNIKLRDYTDMSIQQLQQRAKTNHPRARQELLEVYGIFASEYHYLPVPVAAVPYGAFALEYGRRNSKKLLLNYGAMQCLERLLPLLADQGFILVNEYGSTLTSEQHEFEHQRFSYATAVGLNFPLLKAYFEEGKRCQWIEAPGDSRGIHTRLAGNNISTETIVRFYEKFADAAFTQLQEPIDKARACLKSGRFELAADFYQQALKVQPSNWVLLNEISMFLTHQMRNAKSAIDMSKVALAHNPTCSAELWNALGDALFFCGRLHEARSAYEQAMFVNGSDVRSRYSLAWVHAQAKDYAAALSRISEALVLDKTGAYREELLRKQNDVLAQLALRNQQEYLLLTNLVSRFVKLDDKKPEDAGPTLPLRPPVEPRD